MITSPEDNTLKGLARHCHPVMVQEDGPFKVEGATAHRLGVKRLPNYPPFLVLGDKPFTAQAEDFRSGEYAPVLLRTANPEELAHWNTYGSKRDKPEEVFCLEVLERLPNGTFRLTGQREFFVNI